MQMTDKNGIRNSDFILMHLLQEADYYDEIAQFSEQRGLFTGCGALKEQARRQRALAEHIRADVERTRRRS